MIGPAAREQRAISRLASVVFLCNTRDLCISPLKKLQYSNSTLTVYTGPGLGSYMCTYVTRQIKLVGRSQRPLLIVGIPERERGSR